jgi:O-succinylbenzoic acid--CoA ligase
MMIEMGTTWQDSCLVILFSRPKLLIVYLTFKNKRITFQPNWLIRIMVWKTNRDIIQRQTPPENPYLLKAFDFLRQWIRGKDSFVLNTSGSTGNPKVITVSRQQLITSARMTGQALSLHAGTKALVCLNIGYVAGLMMLVRGMELNWDLTITAPSSNPLKGMDEDFDFIAMVPSQLDGCIGDADTALKLRHVGKILLGGAPVGVDLGKRIQELQTPVFQSYGMTETVSHVAIRRINGPMAQAYYTFLPEVNAGVDDRGCLWVSGAVTTNEVIQTNDLVEMVSENSFHWLGRHDNVINSGGVKILLDQIDAVVAEVLSGSGIAVPFFSWHQPDDRLGQKLVLIVEGRSDEVDGDTVLLEIRKRISAYQTPKHVYFVPRFVKTPTDKVDKPRTAALIYKNLNG